MKRTTLIRYLAFVAVVAVTSGCSYIPEEYGGSKERIDYKRSRSAPALEIPPDLDSSRVQDSLVIPGVEKSANLSDYQSRQTVVRPGEETVLPELADVRVERDGQARWLVVDAPAELVWSKVRQFWLEQGFLLRIEDPRTGIMETDWLENRADIPDGVIRRMLGKLSDFVYSSATRDKYRVRLERGEVPDTTDVYVTHRGVEEVINTDETAQTEDSARWRMRPEDPGLEAEMLGRMMVFLGVEQDRARAELADVRTKPPAAQLVQGPDGASSLLFVEDFPSAWRRVGLALDNVGFFVDDRDRSRGLYLVRYDDPYAHHESGFMSSLAFWNSDQPEPTEEYAVRVRGAEDGGSIITVERRDGLQDDSPTATRILTLLQEKLQ